MKAAFQIWCKCTAFKLCDILNYNIIGFMSLQSGGRRVKIVVFHMTLAIQSYDYVTEFELYNILKVVTQYGYLIFRSFEGEIKNVLHRYV